VSRFWNFDDAGKAVESERLPRGRLGLHDLELTARISGTTRAPNARCAATTIHELGHFPSGLGHETDVYNIMG